MNLLLPNHSGLLLHISGQICLKETFLVQDVPKSIPNCVKVYNCRDTGIFLGQPVLCL